MLPQTDTIALWKQSTVSLCRRELCRSGNGTAPHPVACTWFAYLTVYIICIPTACVMTESVVALSKGLVRGVIKSDLGNVGTVVVRA
jgi:hypothetical protein